MELENKIEKWVDLLLENKNDAKELIFANQQALAKEYNLPISAETEEQKQLYRQISQRALLGPLHSEFSINFVQKLNFRLLTKEYMTAMVKAGHDQDTIREIIEQSLGTLEYLSNRHYIPQEYQEPFMRFVLNTVSFERQSTQTIEPEIGEIKDYVEAMIYNHEEPDLSSWEAAKAASNRWHEMLQFNPNRKKYLDSGYLTNDVVHDFGDGWKMVRISKQSGIQKELNNDLKVEGALMNMCVGDDSVGHCRAVLGGDKIIFSLRDSGNKPHVTVEVDTDGNLLELKGNANEVPPKEKYQQYIVVWLNSMAEHIKGNRCDDLSSFGSPLAQLNQKTLLEIGIKVLRFGKNNTKYVERANGDKYWYQNDQHHRLDGPAVEYADGSKEWYQNGQYHRLDGPAVEDANGSKHWYQNGQRHRLDGPAVEDADGSKYWYQNGQLHRLDGPAIERANGDKYWYQNNQLHRLDGPAVEYANGNKAWYQNGQLHRLDGPAVERADGSKAWYITDTYFGVGDNPPKDFISMRQLYLTDNPEPLRESISSYLSSLLI